MTNKDETATEAEKEIEKTGNELSESLRAQGLTAEEAGLRAIKLGEIIDQYYKDHPEEYKALLRRIPSLENSMKDLIESFKAIIDVFINVINQLFELIRKAINGQIFNDKKHKKNNKKLHRLKRKLTKLIWR
ncbi:MAG: hypothetical protein PHQ32_02470 [Firmicutes bacterium]|nr:hypothetical protein [Bacillota bacterium]